jgi:hypothetical protein
VWLVLVGLLGSVTSSDSGHSTQLDSHSNSSVEVAAGPNQGGCSPPSQHRRHSVIQGKEARPAITGKIVCMCVCALAVLCSYSDMINCGFAVVCGCFSEKLWCSFVNNKIVAFLFGLKMYL